MNNDPALQTILVVDDDEVMRDVLSLTLGLEGHRVSTVASGEEALALLVSLRGEDRPTVVLADLQMPGLSGPKLAKELRAACPPGVVLLAMSASRPKPEEIAAYSGFLLKPFMTEDFAAAVHGGASQAAADAGSGESALTLPLSETIYAQLAATMPPAQLWALYNMCMDDALARIARMRASVDASDATAFIRESHALKGGCGMLGASELYDLATRMETGALSCTPLLDDFVLAVARLRRILEARS